MSLETGKPSPALWAPPSWTVDRTMLEQGRAHFVAMLAPGGSRAVRLMMAELLLTTKPPGTEELDAARAQGFQMAQAAAYEKHLAHVPADLLNAAAERHVKSGTRGQFFPTTAEVLALVTADIEKRQRDLARIETMIANGGKPKAEPPPRRLTAEEMAEERKARLRQTRDTWRKLGRPDRSDRAERELAALEGRKPELSEPHPLTGNDASVFIHDEHDAPSQEDAPPPPTEAEF